MFYLSYKKHTNKREKNYYKLIPVLMNYPVNYPVKYIPAVYCFSSQSATF